MIFHSAILAKKDGFSEGMLNLLLSTQYDAASNGERRAQRTQGAYSLCLHKVTRRYDEDELFRAGRRMLGTNLES